ncbi:MAG: SnoaL-like domain-containing protein [Proteobacteria bacterium]|nr:SnoaL-like domain-containing protein [Pseudomonadota bacterium]
MPIIVGVFIITTSSAVLANEAVEIVKKLYSVADGKNYDAEFMDKLIASDFKDHNRDHVVEGVSDRDATIGFYSQLAQGFPDELHKLLMLEPVGEDKALLYWEWSGTNTGSFFDIPPSGNKVKINGIEIFRVKDGQIVDMWHVEQLDKLNKQLQGVKHP